ncbi:hypothetical protein FAIPA1_320043 [Frankia sp. AiPs1]
MGAAHGDRAFDRRDDECGERLGRPRIGAVQPHRRGELRLPATEHRRSHGEDLGARIVRGFLDRHREDGATRLEIRAGEHPAPQGEQGQQSVDRAGTQHPAEPCRHSVTSEADRLGGQLLLPSREVVVGGAQRRLGVLGNLADAGGIEAAAADHIGRSRDDPLTRRRDRLVHWHLFLWLGRPS